MRTEPKFSFIRSLRSAIKTGTLVDEDLIFSNEVFRRIESTESLRSIHGAGLAAGSRSFFCPLSFARRRSPIFAVRCPVRLKVIDTDLAASMQIPTRLRIERGNMASGRPNFFNSNIFQSCNCQIWLRGEFSASVCRRFL
jgi:hypothetical protein